MEKEKIQHVSGRSMKQVLLVLVKLIILPGLLFLGGCANFLDFAMHRNSLSNDCAQAKFLYTDLAGVKKDKTYFLPNGQQCPPESEGGVL